MSALIPKHGGYRKLKSFQLSQLVYDITVRFCDRYIDKYSRTKDQMIQAARSGVQNIAEGSQASATSKKIEIKLTQVARASLEELKLDYEDFLRHRKLEHWSRDNPLRQQIIDHKFQNADQVSHWISTKIKSSGLYGLKGLPSQKTSMSSQSTKRMNQTFSANTVLVLITVACFMLDRQVEKLAQEFEKEGGFTERMYRIRSRIKNNPEF